MSKKHFYLIRHGETEFNKSLKLQGRGINAPLNDNGWRQAEHVANAFLEVPITQIIASSLKRAQESAEPLCRQKGIEYQSYKELDEMDFGDWEGRLFGEVEGEIMDIQAQWIAGKTDIRVPGGESPTEVFERAGSKLKEIAQQTNHAHTAVVIHGRLLRVLLAGLLDAGLENMHYFKHQNGAINHIVWQNDGFTEIELNKIDHLSNIEIFIDK